jgi:hypothetical protein
MSHFACLTSELSQNRLPPTIRRDKANTAHDTKAGHRYD